MDCCRLAHSRTSIEDVSIRKSSTSHLKNQPYPKAGAVILTPPLLLAECTSAIRRYVTTRLLTADEAAVALGDLSALDVTVMSDTIVRCRATYDWALPCSAASVW